MANTYVDYTGNGSTTDFNFSFPYIKTSHVAVEVNDGQGAGGTNQWVRKTLTTDYSVQTSPNTFVRFVTAPASNVKVRVLRDSVAEVGIVDFANGSVLTETELDNSYQHNRYLAEEAEEGNTGGALTKRGTEHYNADGLKLENVADPDSDDDAVNKGYADTRYVDAAGDTMSGNLDMSANKVTSSVTPASGNDLTNKTYVDDNDALQVTKSGDTMSGDLNMGSNKITNVTDPSANQEAATKKYVDDTITTSFASGSPPPGNEIGTAAIEDDAVTYAKLQNVAANNVLIGNDNGAGVDAQELTATEARALLNVADGATANDSDANLKDRANHTGTQTAATILDLATVATSGSYNDLSNQPTIPINNNQLTNGANYVTGLVDTDSIKWPIQGRYNAAFASNQEETDGNDRYLATQLRRLVLTNQEGSRNVGLTLQGRLSSSDSDNDTLSSAWRIQNQYLTKSDTGTFLNIQGSDIPTPVETTWFRTNRTTFDYTVKIAAFAATPSTTQRHYLSVWNGITCEHGDIAAPNGSLTANAKPFRIPHPVIEDKKLVHIATESPRADLIYRGKVQLIAGTATASIDTASNMVNGTFSALTRNTQVFIQNNETFDRVKARVDNGSVIIDCENNQSTCTIEWMVVAERKDDYYLKTFCDESGEFITDSDLTEKEIKANEEVSEEANEEEQ